MASVDIGKKLKDARLQKDMSLDELQQITKTQKRYLVAIEENDFDSMPGTFYVRAFIRQYASAVGLDGNELVAIYDGKEGELTQEQAPKEEVMKESRTQIYDSNNKLTKVINSLPAIIFSLIGLTITIIVLYITWENRNALPVIDSPNIEVTSIPSSITSESTTESSETQESTVTESSSTTESSSSETPPITFSRDADYSGNVVMTAMNLPETTALKLSFTAKDAACWVGITAPDSTTTTTGGYFFQGTVNPGQTQETELPIGTSRIYLNLGAAQNLEMTLDGQKIDFNPGKTITGSKTVTIYFDYTQQSTDISTDETVEVNQPAA